MIDICLNKIQTSERRKYFQLQPKSRECSLIIIFLPLFLLSKFSFERPEIWQNDLGHRLSIESNRNEMFMISL